MSDNQELVLALTELASKLASGQVTARQLQLAIDQRMMIVKDQPQAGQDPEVERALSKVATSFIEAWVKEYIKIGQQIAWELGYGVAVGNFGPEFIKELLAKCEKENKQ